VLLHIRFETLLFFRILRFIFNNTQAIIPNVHLSITQNLFNINRLLTDRGSGKLKVEMEEYS